MLNKRKAPPASVAVIFNHTLTDVLVCERNSESVFVIGNLFYQTHTLTQKDMYYHLLNIATILPENVELYQLPEKDCPDRLTVFCGKVKFDDHVRSGIYPLYWFKVKQFVNDDSRALSNWTFTKLVIDSLRYLEVQKGSNAV